MTEATASDAVQVTDAMVDFVRAWIDLHGDLPGRHHLSRKFDLSDWKARKAMIELRKQFLIDHGDGFKIPVEDAPEFQDNAALWKWRLERNRKVLRSRERTMYRHVYFDEVKPLAACFPADLHLGSCFTDLARVQDDQELIAATPRCYQINGGDIFDNAIKHRSMMVNGDVTPPEEIRLLEQMLTIAGKRFLGVVSGNHDDWTPEQVGVDVLKMMFGQSGIIYSPARLHLTIHLGEQEYRIAVTHKYRYNSGMNPLHAVQRMLERGQDDWDIGVIGHNHECMVGDFLHRGISRIAVRPGSYQISSGFALRHGFNDSVPSCPCVILRPDRREMYHFRDLRPGLDCFQSEFAK